MSYLYQNFDYDSKRMRDHERTEADKRLLALMIASEITGEFASGKVAPNGSTISGRLGISPTLSNELLARLVQNHVLNIVAGSEYDDSCYVPALPVAKMTVLTVLERYDDLAEADLQPLRVNITSSKAAKAIEELKRSMIDSKGNLPVCELLNR